MAKQQDTTTVDALIDEENTMIPLELGGMSTVEELIETLKTFNPKARVLLNQQHPIATVDGRGDVLWLCDRDHSPLAPILRACAAVQKEKPLYPYECARCANPVDLPAPCESCQALGRYSEDR